MDKKKLSAVLTFVTPDIIERLMKSRCLNYDAAANTLYGSKLYAALENPETGVWRLSPLTLFSMLEEELSTGKISFPEEQS